MLVLEGELEIATVRNALELRERTSGVGTAEHERCKEVLRKLDEAEQQSKSEPTKDNYRAMRGF